MSVPVALVTGAARNIGRAIATRLAADGFDVACVDMTEDSLTETVAEVESLGRRAVAVAADVSDPESSRAAVDATMEAFGRVDVLVNNAGITRDGLLLRMSEEDFGLVLSVNLKGVFHFSKAAARPMMKQRSGRIINISSVIGLRGNAGQSNYAASKAGVIGFTKSLAQELASRGILVNAVAPGFIGTAMTENLPESVKEGMLKSIPLGKLGTPENVAGIVSFLASEDSSYVTGQVLTVDGGMVM
ncbi:MAG: 3-oxoacyl-[acyl-carrier-protein] reductase [Gemmatimonadota bacterium]|jgi:3-oxoacyl-[acyl-carrier protein] reductase|nr:3-oxoacyl-[acyl-carrier-protein] reductase [Gemmatimonadota bacterium]MDP6529320.1 3-oxoacyl-[acyl-carrier-protein] reductase [Gemmatimonadota bacterium]MDP6802205.1 3-oxoacyl-[acyl-carrier-protein] reductase [Gemmatimonadota bacterium]